MGVLGSIDTAVLAVTLLVSTSIGVFFAWKNKNDKSTEEYYFGGRKIHPIPVAASLSVSFVSAIAVISLPVEVYLYGAVFVWNVLAQLIATFVAVIWYVPLYHRLKLTSVYQFLEWRFNRIMRIMASLCSCINLFLYLGLITYLPALALSATTSLSIHVAIAITSVVCTLYTSIGGMKAVVWTDLVQFIIMFSGMLGVFIRTAIVVGGLDEIIGAAERGGRVNVLKFDVDPRTRSTAWSIAIGIGLNSCFQTGCDQVYIQRYLSCRNVTAARTALLLTLLPGIFFTMISVGNGLAVYAYYENCDPFAAGDLDKVDQLLPSMVVRIFHGFPGMAGLFVAAAYCGTLSSISSGINAMSALILNDFIKPFSHGFRHNTEYILATGISILIGVLVMSFAYLISYSSSNLIELFVSFSGWIAGPMIGVFTMGIFMPWVNSKGAVLGFLSGWIAVGWIGISAMLSSELYSPEPMGGRLPVSTKYCDKNNVTDVFTQIGLKSVNSANSTDASPWIHKTIYSLSPFWYGAIGFIVCLIIGNIVSLIFSGRRESKNKSEQDDMD